MSKSAKLLLLFLPLLFTACGSLIQQKLDPNIYYRRDIALEINGVKFDGVAVPLKSDSYTIKLRAQGQIDLLTITSCHREFKVEHPSSGFWSKGDAYTYTYIPIKGIEDGRGCLLDIGAYEKTEGRHSWATIDFETAGETIWAATQCNGKNSTSGGVSICQAKAGLIQQVIFTEPMKVAPLTGCDVMKTKDNLVYEYIAPKGECIYYFVNKNGEVHRHDSIGYESILIRGI